MEHKTTRIDQVAIEAAGGKTLEQLRQEQEGYRESKRPTAQELSEETAEKTRLYWESVFEQPARQSPLMVVRSRAQEMEYEDARKKFWAVLQMRAAHISVNTNRPDFEWLFDETAAARVKNMLKYFINDPTGEYPLHKGLFLYGAPGTGKTEMMQAFQRFTGQYELSKRFEFSNMSQVYDSARRGADEVQYQEQGDRCLDEFGRITGPVLQYGNPIDLNEAILEARYIRFQRYGQLTSIVTNATPERAKQIFSPALYDRIRAMCTPVLFAGQSFRQ